MKRKYKELLEKTRQEVLHPLRKQAIKNIELRRKPGTPPWPISESEIENEIQVILRKVI